MKLGLGGSRSQFGPQGYRFQEHYVLYRPKGQDGLIQGTRNKENSETSLKSK